MTRDKNWTLFLFEHNFRKCCLIFTVRRVCIARGVARIFEWGGGRAPKAREERKILIIQPWDGVFLSASDVFWRTHFKVVPPHQSYQLLIGYGRIPQSVLGTSGGTRPPSPSLPVATPLCIARTMPWQGVRPSVCLSHAGIVSKQLYRSSKSFNRRVAPPF